MSDNPKLIRAMKEGKAPFEYLVLDVLEEDARVHAGGGEKYGIFNWRLDNIKASTYKAAILRHFVAWFGGEDFDRESGHSHLAHIRACCAILRDSQMRNTLIDDRHFCESIDQDTRETTSTHIAPPVTGLNPAGEALTPIGMDNLIDDMAKTNEELDCRLRHEEILMEPGFYVEFNDNSPGIDCSFVTVIGPFEGRQMALDVRDANPGNFAGTSTVFEIR